MSRSSQRTQASVTCLRRSRRRRSGPRLTSVSVPSAPSASSSSCWLAAGLGRSSAARMRHSTFARSPASSRTSICCPGSTGSCRNDSVSFAWPVAAPIGSSTTVWRWTAQTAFGATLSSCGSPGGPSSFRRARSQKCGSSKRARLCMRSGPTSETIPGTRRFRVSSSTASRSQRKPFQYSLTRVGPSSSPAFSFTPNQMPRLSFGSVRSKPR